jgi:hypothetical protein
MKRLSQNKIFWHKIIHLSVTPSQWLLRQKKKEKITKTQNEL